jgi:hypothetical protein
MTPSPKSRSPKPSAADQRQARRGGQSTTPPPEPNPSQLDERIEQAFRDVLRKAVAWRMTTDHAQGAEVEHAARSLHAAVVEYEAAIAAWTDVGPNRQDA